MDPSACQALCGFGCEVSSQLGALVALAAWSLASTLLALWTRFRLRGERTRATEAERLAVEEHALAAAASKDAAYWREQSMRAPPMPREAIELQLLSLPVPTPSTAPEASEEAEEAARAGTRWVDFGADYRRRSEAPEASEEPDGPEEQFADEPTGAGKRKRP